MSKKQNELEKVNAEAEALASSPVIRTEEGRALLNLLRRTIEIMLFGEAKTLPLKRNHE